MKSKILTYLSVPESVSDGFSQDVKDLVHLLDGTQEIYAQSTNEKKKAQLAKGIVAMMRILMEYLRGKNLGVYANMKVVSEQKALPEPKVSATPKMAKPQPSQPQPQMPTPQQITTEPPSTEPPSPEPPKKKERKPKATKPTPPDTQDKPEYTKEELEDLIDFTSVLAEDGDEEAIQELNKLNSIFERFYK